MILRFREFLSVEAKSKNKAGEGLSSGSYKFFTSSQIQSKFLNTWQYATESLVFGTGGSASVHYVNERFSTSTDCLVMTNKMPERVNLKCVFYFLIGNIHIIAAGFKGCGLQHISKDYILNIEIRLPEKAIQDKIVRNFDLLSGVRSAKQEQLARFDQLVKSQFIEMFGAIPKDSYAPLDRVCNIITDGTHQPPKFSDSGIPFLFVSNLANNEIDYQTQKFISKDTYAGLIKRTPIQIGDVLLSTVGSYGHPAVVTDDREFCFQRHIAYLKPNAQLIDSRFLYGALLSPIGQEQIERAVKGIAQKTLNLSEIRKIRVPLPSCAHQKQYSAFYEQTDKSKDACEIEVAA